MREISLTDYLAWLVAPTSEQRWETSREILKQIPSYQFVQYRIKQEKTFLGQIEGILRKFWLRVASYLPLWLFLEKEISRRKYKQEQLRSLDKLLKSLSE